MRIASLVTFSVFAPLALAAPPDKIDFEKHVRPLLAQKCFACHGDEVQQSGLRLDKRQNAMRGGDYGPVIVAGHSDQSKLIRRVVNGDGGMKMPPSGALTADEIDLLKAWIDQGADYRMEIKPEAPVKPVDPKLLSLISTMRTGSLADVEKAVAADKSLLRAQDAGGSTVLHHAAGFGSVAALKLLIAKGADVNAKNRRGSTPLHWAVREEAKVRVLLEKGAAVDARQADGRTPLYLAATMGNGNTVLRLLLEKGADPNVATSNGNTSLSNAAARGDVEAIRLLLAKKADVNAASGTGATALMAAAGSRNPDAVALLLQSGAKADALTKKNESALMAAATAGDDRSVKLLLDKGVDVNVRDDRGYSALMLAASSEFMNATSVKMLLAKGADVNVTGEYETPKTLAAKRGETEVARLLGVPEADLKLAGVAPLPPARPTLQPVGEAVEKGLALLEKQSHNFIRIAGCNSCHSQDLPSAAAAIARDRGLRAPKAIAQLSETMNGETAERIMDFVAASASSLGWELLDKDMNHAPRDFYTDAAVHYTMAMQNAEGYWRNPQGRRPPMNTGDFQGTAMSISTLRRYSPPESAAETKQMLARAAAWLTRQQPDNTQDRAFQLLGLAWSGEASPAAIDRAAKSLIASQRQDGGWSQLAGMGSDAYASGQALFALNAAGKMPATDPVYKKGVEYLLRSQQPDGSWHVKTRSIWLQPYFESGFPHGQDQFISSAGTAWAAMALTMTVEPPKMTSK
ncbi:MAG: Planctomycete cytochrome [Bryobacterales bacterium]|nr:Planctomycete cytochrome [Bryobacterales bacterium]